MCQKNHLYQRQAFTPPGAATTSALGLMSQKLCVIDVCNRTISVCTAGAPRHRNRVFIGALKDLGEMAERTGLELVRQFLVVPRSAYK